jgi:cytochrome c-type biogenesis protein CcmH/NrfG
LLCAVLALAGCLPALSIIPVTPLLSTALSTRPGDEESAKAIAGLEVKQDWDGISALALKELKAAPADDDWLVVLGYSRMRAGDYRAAIEAFNRVATRSPEDSDARNLLGESLRLSGQPERATEVLERAVVSHPSSVTGWFLLGQAYADSQRVERAKSAFQEAVRLEPDYGAGWLGLATLLARVGPRDEYERALERLKETSPDLLAEHVTARAASTPSR